MKSFFLIIFLVAGFFSFSENLVFAQGGTSDTQTPFQRFLNSTGLFPVPSPSPNAPIVAPEPFSPRESGDRAVGTTPTGGFINISGRGATEPSPVIGLNTGGRISGGGSCGSGGTPQTFRELICLVVNIIELLNGVVFLLALLAFFWGIARYVSSAGDEKAAKEGKTIMIWGALGVAVALSLGGIIAFLIGDFGFGL